MQDHPDTQSVVQTALDGDAVLFVGAGFSRNAMNVRGEKLKTASELTDLLCRELDLDEHAELSAAAEMFADERSNAALVTLLREQFQVQNIADEHQAFGRVPWRRVYTTNYDDVVELAYRSTGRAIVSLTAEDDVSYVSSEQPQCIHVNGYIGTLTEDRLFADFRLTDSSYATTAFASSQWAQQMRHDFAVARVVVFVGYSLQDLDIQRLLKATHAQRDKTVFYVGLEPSRVLSHRLSKFGSVVGLDACAFAECIATEISDYTPPEPRPTLGRVVVRRAVASTAQAPQDRDIGSLFLWGAANHDFIWGSVAETNTWRYICYRDQLDQALQLLDDGVRNVVIRSDLGNGKSIFLDSLDCLATGCGFDVLRIDGLGEAFESEVECAARAKTKTLLIVDAYNNKRAALDIIATNRSEHLYLVCAARTIRHDVAFRWLHGVLRTSDVPEIDLEILSKRERKWFREALDEYGLWGRYASRSAAAKDRLLAGKCKSRISSVLLLILESPTIAERLADLVNTLASKRKHLETIAGLLMLSVLDFHPSFDMLTDLMGTEVLNQAEFQRSDAVRQLLDFRYERVKVRIECRRLTFVEKRDRQRRVVECAPTIGESCRGAEQ